MGLVVYRCASCQTERRPDGAEQLLLLKGTWSSVAFHGSGVLATQRASLLSQHHRPSSMHAALVAVQDAGAFLLAWTCTKPDQDAGVGTVYIAFHWSLMYKANDELGSGANWWALWVGCLAGYARCACHTRPSLYAVCA
jgi:hypothetical protein